jgi:hypothetical protein
LPNMQLSDCRSIATSKGESTSIAVDQQYLGRFWLICTGSELQFLGVMRWARSLYEIH